MSYYVSVAVVIHGLCSVGNEPEEAHKKLWALASQIDRLDDVRIYAVRRAVEILRDVRDARFWIDGHYSAIITPDGTFHAVDKRWNEFGYFHIDAPVERALPIFRAFACHRIATCAYRF